MRASRKKAYARLRREKNKKKRALLIRDVHDCNLFMLLSFTGLRISEALTLKVGDIKSDCIIIQKENSKNNQEGVVFFGDKTRRVLAEIERGKSLLPTQSSLLFPPRQREGSSTCAIQSRSYASRRLKYWLDKSGLPTHYSLHSFRHAYATHSLDSGVPLATLKHQLRHSSVSTTSQYLHFTNRGKEAISKLF